MGCARAWEALPQKIWDIFFCNFYGVISFTAEKNVVTFDSSNY